MADSFADFTPGLDSPPTAGFAITPHDSNDLAEVTRFLFVGGAGSVKVLLADDSTPVTLAGLTAGTMLKLRVKRVYATDTDATNMVGFI